MFLGDDDDELVRALPDEVIAELQVFCAILPTFHCNLGRGIHRAVPMSDTSLKGYAGHSAELDVGECKRLGSVQERWRFKAERRPPGDGVGVQ